MWVKICGITNLEDALSAVDAGANALGFVFYEKSPRKVQREQVRQIVASLPESVEKVGVFVDPDPDHIRRVVAETGITAVQLHGKSGEGGWKNPRQTNEWVGVPKLIPAIHGDSLKEDFALEEGVSKNLFAILLDSKCNGAAEVGRETFDWEATRDRAQSLGLAVPVIVAGGLNASNVARAVGLFQPFGVDVASGVEAHPGKKDPYKVRAFIAAARNADRKAQ